MLQLIDLRGRNLTRQALREILPRAATDVDAAVRTVGPLCEDVRLRGEPAVREITARLDRVEIDRLRVSTDRLRAALSALNTSVRAALEEAIARVRRVHEQQRRADVTTQVVPGGTVSQWWRPVGRVGLYVPGGLAVYPSSVVMNVVPAQIAGVASLAVASPPQREYAGDPHPAILAACALLGVEEVYRVGGAQAIAMFAYGAGECEPVDLVTGPGNVYVTAAKRLMRGVVGIDAEAGTTEIAVLADDSADPRHVAADLISQAEHDPGAASVLVTDSEPLLAAVESELAVQVQLTKHTERIRTALTGPQSGAVLVADVEHGLQVVDAYAAEHLEIQTRDARSVAGRVRNAGAIFVGAHSPVSLGDYCAGSNHVLPTGGCARHSSGLSVQTFLRGIGVVVYDAAALRVAGSHVLALSEAEDLPAHGAAVTARL